MWLTRPLQERSTQIFLGVLFAAVVLVLIILFIQKRPRGLFPQKGRAAEG